MAVLVLAVMSLLFSVASAAVILGARPEFRVQFVPDDTFYYLTLARHFAASGQWTFDGGVSVTTGFHPLHAYVLAALAAVGVSAPEALVRAGLAYTYAITFLVIAGVALWCLRRVRLIPALLLTLLVFSRNVSLNSTAGVEWPWVVLCGSVYCLLVSGAGPVRGRVPLAFAAALCGTLARTDFPLLPFAMGVVGLAAWWLRADARRLPAATLVAGIGGGAAGTIFNVLHTLWISGTAIQSSARMKMIWSERMYGPSLEPILRLYRALFADESRLAGGLLLVLIALVGTAGWTLWRRWLGRQAAADSTADATPPAVLWLGSLATILGYLALYRLGPAAVQCWYSANLLAPSFLLLAVSAVGLRGSWRQAALALVLLALLALRLPAALHWMETPEWPHQVSMYRAGCYLHEAELPGRVGSWNAGIIGYYAGGHVINLDGLVNNAVYPYIVDHDLQGYLDRERIAFIADYPNMFDPRFAFRGGYAGPELPGRLQEIVAFENNVPGAPRTRLYRVGPRAPAPR